MEQIHARFGSYMSNDAGFVKVTLAERHHFHTIVQVYKILHQLVPVYLQDMFMFSENVSYWTFFYIGNILWTEKFVLLGGR